MTFEQIIYSFRSQIQSCVLTASCIFKLLQLKLDLSETILIKLANCTANNNILGN